MGRLRHRERALEGHGIKLRRTSTRPSLPESIGRTRYPVHPHRRGLRTCDAQRSGFGPHVGNSGLTAGPHRCRSLCVPDHRRRTWTGSAGRGDRLLRFGQRPIVGSIPDRRADRDPDECTDSAEGRGGLRHAVPAGARHRRLSQGRCGPHHDPSLGHGNRDVLPRGRFARDSTRRRRAELSARPRRRLRLAPASNGNSATGRAAAITSALPPSGNIPASSL